MPWAPVLGAALALLLAAAGYCLYQALVLRRTLNNLEAMLDQALAGDFRPARWDESRLSRMEQKLMRFLHASALARGKAEEERAQIKQLVGDISHQTRTPLANILLYGQLLQEQPLPPAAQPLVQAVNAQTEKLQFLIEALVKTSRLESGVLRLRAGQNPVAPLMEHACQPYLAAARQKGVQLVVRPTQASAWFDPKWAAEALGNLVDNAVKYTPAGGQVWVQAVEYELFCGVCVSDDGPGIPESEQAEIFGRFYRGRTAGSAPGVGIGLYLARKIAQAGGGYLRVRSAPGQGAAFTCYLPRARQHTLPQAPERL